MSLLQRTGNGGPLFRILEFATGGGRDGQRDGRPAGQDSGERRVDRRSEHPDRRAPSVSASPATRASEGEPM
jgi:hypothetical protein